MAEPAQTQNGGMKIYPAKEMRAVDMAEALKALTLFEGVRRVDSTDIPVNGGIIQGCQITAPQNTPTQLRMTAGRILICGRLAEFTPDDNFFYFTGPSVAETTTCTIVAVCDLSSPANPFYISIVTGSGLASLDAAASRTTDELFNRNNGLRYLRLGTVKVAANGVLSELSPNPNSSPVKSNKAYLDGVKNQLTSSISANDGYAREWISYFQKSRHKSDFFTAYRAVGDGLTVAANSTVTFKFRSEYGSKVYIQSGSGSDAIPQETWANVYVEPNGRIISQKADTAIHPAPAIGPNGAPTDIVTDKWKFLGINEIRIENASASGNGASNCVIQSYYSESVSGSAGGGGHVCAAIRNTGSAAAKIKLTIRSMYVADIG